MKAAQWYAAMIEHYFPDGLKDGHIVAPVSVDGGTMEWYKSGKPTAFGFNAADVQRGDVSCFDIASVTRT